MPTTPPSWPDDRDPIPAHLPGTARTPRDALNLLLCLAAVAGIGFGGWSLWREIDERRDHAASLSAVGTACGGLIDAHDVMDLDGGIVRAKPGTAKDDRFDGAAGSCTIYRVGKPGSSYDHFGLSVEPYPSDRYAHIAEGSGLGPFFDVETPHRDPSRELPDPPEVPMGDGALGMYRHDSVWTQAACRGSDQGDAHTSVFARATADFDKVTEPDRRILARIASDAVRAAAAKLKDCRVDLPRPPERLPEPGRRLIAARDAKENCGWYAPFVKAKGSAELLDRAMDIRSAARTWEESCVLGASPSLMRNLYRDHRSDAFSMGSLQDVLRNPEWMRFDSYYGGDAAEVVIDGSDGQETLEPGTAGYNRHESVWWASSVCRGDAATHVMTVDLSYDMIVRDRLRRLFRAYVDDAAKRHGCDHVVFPEDADFRH